MRERERMHNMLIEEVKRVRVFPISDIHPVNRRRDQLYRTAHNVPLLLLLYGHRRSRVESELIV